MESQKSMVYTALFLFFFDMSPSRVQGLGGAGGRGDQNSDKNQKIIQIYAVYTMVFLIFQPLERGFGISEKKSDIFLPRKYFRLFSRNVFGVRVFFRNLFRNFVTINYSRFSSVSQPMPFPSLGFGFLSFRELPKPKDPTKGGRGAQGREGSPAPGKIRPLRASLGLGLRV